MNDFLQSIRNGNFSKDNGNTGKPRYNSQRSRRPYEPNGNYARNGNERKYRPRQQQYDNGVMDETLTTIKETLTAILANQDAGISFAERRAVAEERKADAFEFIARHIGNLTGDNYLPRQDVDDFDAVQSGEINTRQARTNRSVSHDDNLGENSADMSKDDILELIVAMRNDGSTYNEIASHLDDLNLPTFSGRGKWHAQTIHRLCQTA